jgi:hypothetical protein
MKHLNINKGFITQNTLGSTILPESHKFSMSMQQRFGSPKVEMRNPFKANDFISQDQAGKADFTCMILSRYQKIYHSKQLIQAGQIC